MVFGSNLIIAETNNLSITYTEYEKQIRQSLHSINFPKSGIIGIGEASHGTVEFQIFRKVLLSYLVSRHQNLEVFIETPYSSLRELQRPGLSEDKFNSILRNSKVYEFYKAGFFPSLLYELYKRKIRFRGIDVYLNGLEQGIENSEVGKFVLNANNELKKKWDDRFRDNGMQELIARIQEKGSLVILFSHNYHISKKVFSNITLSIALSTNKGSVRLFDKISNKFIIRTFESTKLIGSEMEHFGFIKKKNFQFYNFGYDAKEHWLMDGSQFDYVFNIPTTRAYDLPKPK